MYFVPQRRSSKNKTILYSEWPLRNMARLQAASGVCVFLNLQPFGRRFYVIKRVRFSVTKEYSYLIKLQMCEDRYPINARMTVCTIERNKISED